MMGQTIYLFFLIFQGKNCLYIFFPVVLQEPDQPELATRAMG